MTLPAVVLLQRNARPLVAVGAVLVLLSLLSLLGIWEHLAEGRSLAVVALVCGCAVLLASFRLRTHVGACLQATDALNQRLQLLAGVSRHVGSPILVTDSDGRAVWVNEAFERDTGYRSAEMLGTRPGPRFRSPHADPKVVEQVRQALKTHSDLEVDLLHRFRDGKDRWVRLILAAQRNEAQRFTGFVVVMVDVDRQVRIRNAYRQTLRDQAALFNALDEYTMMAEADAEGRFTRVNPRFATASGYAEDELIGQTIESLASDRHPAFFWGQLWERVRAGRPWQGELCHRGKQGQLFWTQALITPFTDEHGQLERLVMIQSDVSEHHQARRELSKSQSLLTRTSRLAGVGGWYTDPVGHGLHMTPECRRLLGIDDLKALSLGDLWQVFDAGARLTVRQALRELETNLRPEVSLVVPVNPVTGATARWVKMVASHGETDADGSGRTVRRLIGAVQDYTPQVLAQQRIREEQRIMHSAVDAVGEAFALFDAQGQLLYCNDEQAAWLPGHSLRLGMPHAEMLQLIARQGMFQDAIGREADWVDEVLAAPQRGDPDRIRQTVDGRWIRFVDRITADGHRVVLRHDVTELQSALVRADAAVASKEQFLANMSHEIRTPLNAVTGMLQLLADTSLDPQQSVMVEKSRLAARSLLGVINDVLDFSKISAGKMELHPAPFRLADLRREIEAILEGALAQRRLQLVIEADSSLPEVLTGDAVRLRQVLVNLGGNAIKFTEQGRVTLGWQRLACTESTVRVRFFVRDTGIGIAPEKQASVFESFAQEDASTHRRYGGSGLGLTISRYLVERMGGRIQLESEPGRGSLFWFDIELPVAAEANLAPLSPPTPAALLRLDGVRVLLVEDNELNQEVARSLLAKVGAQVTLAVNGLQAIERLRVQPQSFDVVLMDMQMPVLDGLRATESIRRGLGLVDLPVVAMTANATVSDRDACFKSGMNAHIGKPFDIGEVVSVVRQLMRTAGHEPSRASPLSAGADGAGGAVLEDAAALRRLGGDADLLVQLRARFVDAAQGLVQQADARLARAEWSAVADAMHQLKASAGVIGAPRLSHAAVMCEDHFRRDVQPFPAARGKDMLDQVRWDLANVVAQLSVAPPASGPGAARPTGKGVDGPAMGAALEALKALQPLLVSADMEAIDEYDRWRQTHAVARDPRFSQFNDCIERMDLIAAADECARLLSASDHTIRSPE
ncbi:PAS domain S-box protein [Hydrogenophaga sp.]|uniref:PAS domain S-box protein n=1 Tax=Hydrogenophaga sp. TaxID=1904254 RepID=UPI002C22829F|nr:PAS domain S-box protein [Hydrogenophaga sp.]HMP11708.1 PAS domain S-box protein [Hydrogenophaga sp.]